jgi:hypothetical protein
MLDRREWSEPVLPTPAALLARLGYDAERAAIVDLAHNRWLSAGVWGVRMATGQKTVLKYVRSDRSRGETPWEAHWTADDHDPQRWTYWAREPLAYEHDLTSAFSAGGIVAPARLASAVDDREASLLLEWVDGQPGERWTLDSYAAAAEALGLGQASYLVSQTLPPFPWLSTKFLRQYSSEKPVDWDLLHDDDAWQHPLVRETFPADLREAVTLLHDHREQLYAISESLPRTLCHLDFWPKNLFRGSDGRTTLIDWSFIGLGSIGEDVGNIVPDSSLDHFVAAKELPDLEQAIFDGYLNGLRAGGWNDDPSLIRLGMWASAVKYDWMTPFTLAQARQERQYRYGGGGEIDARYKFSERSQVMLFIATRARQALELAQQLGL